MDTEDRASADVEEETEREETEESVQSGDEYEEMAGVAGMEGEGDDARAGGEMVAGSMDCRCDPSIS